MTNSVRGTQTNIEVKEKKGWTYDNFYIHFNSSHRKKAQILFFSRIA